MIFDLEFVDFRSMSHFSLPIPVSRQISETAGSAHSRVVRDVSAEVAPKTRALLAIEDYDEEAAAKKVRRSEIKGQD